MFAVAAAFLLNLSSLGTNKTGQPVSMYVYIRIHICIDIYIYVEREREIAINASWCILTVCDHVYMDCCSFVIFSWVCTIC